MSTKPVTEKPRTLAEEYAERKLIRPNQFKKIPLADHDKYEKVTFDWGTNPVVGWRKK